MDDHTFHSYSLFSQHTHARTPPLFVDKAILPAEYITNPSFNVYLSEHIRLALGMLFSVLKASTSPHHGHESRSALRYVGPLYQAKPSQDSIRIYWLIELAHHVCFFVSIPTNFTQTCSKRL